MRHKISLLFKNIYYSLPLQLVILHARKFQVLLLFWVILFSTVASSFMKTFGADALFFSPEYLGSINFFSALITGIALGIFIMSWNITTFILHSKRIKFLATTSNPFLKYCVNNSIIPLVFIVYYFCRLYQFNQTKELMQFFEIAILILGLLTGIIITLLVSFAYFFTAEKTIERSMAPIVNNPDRFNKTFSVKKNYNEEFGLKVYWYFSTGLRINKCRNVSHYRQTFLDSIFKRHHLAAIGSIVIAFAIIVTTGFLQDYKAFEIPAAASTLIVFSLLIAVMGAVTYFLQSWSVLAVIVFVICLNILYTNEIIDPRNKAYGLNYTNKQQRPLYNKIALQQLCTPTKMETDKQNMLTILNNWKVNQQQTKPLLVFINVSGGGLRSASFTMNALQQMDSAIGGTLMKQCFMINGASGGMLAASYYRALYDQKQKDSSINLHDVAYTNAIAEDLLNPVFTSFMARDIFAPVQKFKVGDNEYVKDRGYAFEKKLNSNASGLLGATIASLAAKEKSATIPMIIFNSVIKADGRKMMISTQPISFLMQPTYLQKDTSASPDAVDFGALFYNQNPQNLRLLTALRMNATFPYVLPNVWLPSKPIIDVMDAGLRDNYGQETTLRFIDNFKEWISQNTSGVLIIQIRDRKNDGWQKPFETNSVTDMIVTPATMLQYNWFKLQDYYQTDAYNYFYNTVNFPLHKQVLMYVSSQKEGAASLNFHISTSEKLDVINAYKNVPNQLAVDSIVKLLKAN